MKELLSLKNAWKVYDSGSTKTAALRGVNVVIGEDDFIAIMGASGSGKSTMLHLCGLLDKPSQGAVYVGNTNTSTLPRDGVAEIRNQKIGFIFQQFNLIPYLTTIDNIALPHLFVDSGGQDVRLRARNLLAAVGLRGKERNKPTELSGGEQQRVAIARALINDPPIILADEPTGNLDSVNGKHIMKLLVDLHQKQKKTLVIVTHDPGIAEYADRLVQVKDGLIVYDGPVKGGLRS